MPDVRDHDLLGLLAERAADRLREDEAAQSYLRKQGVTDPATCAAYRLGWGGHAVVEDLDAPARTRLKALGIITSNGACPLTSPGLVVPTFDPNAPEHPVGFVKVAAPGSNHRFISHPQGLACTANVADSKRILLCDAPLLMLRLAQAGATGAVLVEDPAVLAPHLDWLAGKELFTCAYKRKGMDALLAGLGALREKAQAVYVHLDFWRTDKDALAKLGVTAPPPVKKPPAVTTKLLADLVAYARQRLEAGEGAQLLTEAGVTDAAFVEGYGLGYLPLDFRKALPKGSRGIPNLRGNALVVPALDEQDRPVDLLLFNRQGNTTLQASLKDPPEGLLAPRVAGACREIVVTTSFKVAARMFAAGRRDVTLLRGEEDARLNAGRLRGMGVRVAQVAVRTETERTAIQEALSAAGIAAEPMAIPKALDAIAALPLEPQPPAAEPVHEVNAAEASPEPAAAFSHFDYPAKPELTGHDARMMRATFTAGDARYEVETAFDVGTKLEVRIERDGKVHLDRFDVSKEAQRKRYAQSAALKTGTPFEAVEAHLIHLLDAVRELQEQMLDPGRKKPAAPAERMAEVEKADALAFLRRPDLLDAVAAGLGELGWAGEERNKRLLFLVALSRKLPDPLHGALRSPEGAGKTCALDRICAVTPPEDVVRVSSLTKAALLHQGDALKHKLLVLAESDDLDREVIVQLRVLLSEGSLRKAGTERDAQTGKIVSDFREAEGPVAFLTSTTRDLDRELLDRCFDLSLDESEAQTKLILEAQRRSALKPEATDAQAGLVTLLRNAQRLLDALPVKIPYAERIEFPAQSVRHRREHQRLLRLIEACALLHQHQRMRDGAYLLADRRDYEIAAALMAGSVWAGEDLSRHAAEVLAMVRGANLEAFTVNDLKALRPGWTRHRFRAGLDELLRLEVLVSPGRSRPRRYEVVAEAAALLATAQPGAGPFGELAAFGEGGLANTSPRQATG